ncbi:MAG: chemotaxis protein CheB [Bacteroidales bacterium]|nr:chemotaxis protein CheB [Bacteroidales bacterium]
MFAVTKKTKSRTSPVRKIPRKAPEKFPIVGIGASAGGLEALEQFLGNIPEKIRMAYVVIQHLDPTQKGMLPELLQRITSMEVYQAADRMPVKVNSVYVIPPNKSMSILNGVLHLFEPVETRGMRLPIDFFLRSLADDRQDLSIGVILSGMGSDGSTGLRAIKEKNGIVAVQDPADAKFDSMPRSAIEFVLVDIIAAARELPGRLMDFLKHIPAIRSDLNTEIKDKSSLDKIIILLRTYTGNDFSLYKKNTLYRRIERRMTVHKIDKIVSYVHFLQGNPKEVEILFKELLIGVTGFFRDPAVWVRLKDTLLPEILSGIHPGTILRAWVPGCSTGEEAFSLAIVFREALEKLNQHGGTTLQIFATDIDPDAIDIARRGIYPANIAADISADRLNRYFISTEDGYRIKTEIREMVVFAQHNIILHPPFTKLDILSCRNLLIYMDPELQKKLIGLFYYSTNPDGILLLGGSETLGNQNHLFTPVDTKLKIYKRTQSSHLPEYFDFPSSFSRSKSSVTKNLLPDTRDLNFQVLADRLLLDYYSPAGVLVNDYGDVIYIHGHTGRYLEPAAGKANMNIFAMLREGLRNEFHHAFRRAVTNKETVVLHNLRINANGNSQLVDIEIRWIDKPELLYGTLMIIFAEVKEAAVISPVSKSRGHSKDSTREKELETELQRMREVMQNSLEEVQTSQEELRSTNEELQSTNEELQSTNEELTTSKEEMQSLNEELQTVNAELQAKVDDYSRVNNDMKNLLNSTEIATLFLDKELNIRRFTLQATKIFKLIKSDIGRPFTDQVSDLNYPGLAEDAREVLRTLIFIQKEIPAVDGRWFLVRIMPYRTFDDRIDGLVITFINISEHKRTEQKLLESEKKNRILLSATSEVTIVLADDSSVMDLSPEAESFFGKNREECLNKDFVRMFVPEKYHKSVERDIKALLSKGSGGRIKIRVLTAAEEMQVVDFFVNLSLNKMKKAEGLILSTNTQQKNE